MNSKLINICVGFDTRDHAGFFFYAYYQKKIVSNWLWMRNIFIPTANGDQFYTPDVDVLRCIVEDQLSVEAAKKLPVKEIDVQKVHDDTHALVWSGSNPDGLMEVSFFKGYQQTLFIPGFLEWDKIKVMQHFHLYSKYFPNDIL